MMRDTGDLVRQLAADGAPVRPLSPPWARAAVWSAASLASVSLLYVLWPHPGLTLSADRGFLIEQGAALATAIVAALAAFTMVVPGRSRTLALAPVVPLALWLGHVGQACVQDWSNSSHIPAILPHWGCFAVTVLAGIIPAMVIVVMLRRGAPLAPRLTTALAALATAGIANFGIRFVHASDPSFVVLAWHVMAVFALSAAATSAGNHVFSWRHRTAAVRVGV